MEAKKPLSLNELRRLSTIRSQCAQLYALALQGKLSHFTVHEERLDEVAAFICQLIAEDYPTLDIPFHSRWRHFEAGNISRHKQLESSWHGCDAHERMRRHVDLVVVSVLLDAGAGAQWAYSEVETGQTHGRSEGLGLASFRMFAEGRFSSDQHQPFQVDAHALAQLRIEDLTSGFQVSTSNPLLGLEGRLSLLQKLSAAIGSKKDIFGNHENPRPGYIIDWLLQGKNGMDIPIDNLWHAVIEGFEEVWPREGRIILEGRNLGDAWHHSMLGSASDTNSIVPFHKLSQWLTFSLLEPLASGGCRVKGLNELTGLPEYRNGGLFIDFEVLKLCDPNLMNVPHSVHSELVVEWRALTVVLLDKVAQRVREKLGRSEDDFPLAKVLEAGTWKAGRRIAAQKRAGGPPPLQVLSDGTVF